MIVASGRSQRHIAAMASHLAAKLKAAGAPVVGVEGADQCSWVLIDAGDIVIHVFKPEMRALYNLEKMWAVAAPPAHEMA